MGIEILKQWWVELLQRNKNQAIPESPSSARSATEVPTIVVIDEWQEFLLFHMCFRTFLPKPIVYFDYQWAYAYVQLTLPNVINVHALSCHINAIHHYIPLSLPYNYYALHLIIAVWGKWLPCLLIQLLFRTSKANFV